MQTALAGSVFLLALLLPVYLLRRFHPLAWPWHVLAAIMALGIGFAPGTALLNSVPGTFLYGFAILFLLIWGVGGLIGLARHREKHLTPKAG
ncbi:MAG: hypothetical protein ABSC23_11265 [Bryobacteraceae bacterium]|jgi:hypothetical protein